jgi:hypothetical protein
MRIVKRGSVMVAVLFIALSAGQGQANNNPNGMVFRAVGWFKGKAEIAEGKINCEIPNVTNAISEGAFAMGLWNTYGTPTLYYPDINSPFGNPCGVWIQLQNNLIDQAIMLDHVNLVFRVQDARHFSSIVPSRNRFPVACRSLRRETLFVGNRLNPVNSTQDTSSGGAPNVAFIEMLPFVTPQLITCLRNAYTVSALTNVYTSLSLVVRATAVGWSDVGDTYRSNTIQYSLNLRHMCGNGRVDDGEVCDPSAPNTCFGRCNAGVCSQSSSIPCASDSDCLGVCVQPDDPSECICVYP